MRILFTTAELSPIAKTGGLGDVAGALPKELRRRGHDIQVCLPYHRLARQWFDANGMTPEPLATDVPITWGRYSASAAYLRTTLPGSDVPLLLIANDELFDREHIYAARDDGFDDFLGRFTFFCHAAIEACRRFDFSPEIIHAHDWHTALLPVFLATGLRAEKRFAATRSVFTIHNLNYQGDAGSDAFAITGLPPRLWAPDAIEHFGRVNPMKAGIIFADEVTTVSPNYAREIQTPEHGAGLDGVLRTLSFKLTGVLNGIDVTEWDPANDAYIAEPYDRDNIAPKTACKRALLREWKWKFAARTPLFGIISRLVDQKGFHLLLPVLPTLLNAGAQVVMLGSGEPALEDGFRRLQDVFPNRCRSIIGFDHALAHRIYAGADALLMPSIYEPCGLNQMYALRYGTIPIVRLTGGLADTVIPFDGANLDVADGFGFIPAAPDAVHAAAWLALLNHRDKPTWRQLQENGMSHDFSWDRSAREYERVYDRARSAG